MLHFTEGDLLQAPVEALVNTVNTVGVMGKGVALQVKKAYPESFRAYVDAVKNGGIGIGNVQVVPVLSLRDVRYIIHFPTKQHWKNPSRLEWIEAGLLDLRKKLLDHEIRSVAIPPLGCGNGGLDWKQVRPLIEKALQDLPLDVWIYEPSEKIREILRSETPTAHIKLTPVRAMLLHLLAHYQVLGEAPSEFAAEKLSYFLQRFGETKMNLSFEPALYGPYSGKVKHVLYALNGVYLRGYEQKDTKPFEELALIDQRLPEVAAFIEQHASPEHKERLKRVEAFISGFETPYGLELLATVDFILHRHPSQHTAEIRSHLSSWSGRKAVIFTDQHIEKAIRHLANFKAHLYPA